MQINEIKKVASPGGGGRVTSFVRETSHFIKQKEKWG